MGEEKVNIETDWQGAYNEDGVDVSLICWFMDLTPAERLSYAESFAQSILKVRALNGVG